MKSFGSSSTLNSSYSFGDANSPNKQGHRGIGAPLFVFITADKEFKKPALIPGGHCHAEVLEGKLFRKVGHSKVISLSSALSAEDGWVDKFHPAASMHMLYRKHPFRDDKYIGVKQFHSVILGEKRREFCDIMRDMGAKTINWIDDAPWVRNYETPGSSTPFLDEDKYLFLQHSAQWQTIVHERTTSWPDNIQIDFTYDDDFSLNDDIINILLKKLSISASTFWGHDLNSKQEDYSLTSQNIFTPSSFPVQVVFFSRSDFDKFNLMHVVHHWGHDHVESLLSIWDMKSLISLAAHRNVSIAAMINCKKEKQLVNLLSSPPGDLVHVRELFRRLASLGDADEDHLIERVEAAATKLRLAREEVAARNAFLEAEAAAATVRTSDNTKHGDYLPREVTPAAIDVSSLEGGDYTLVMVGRGGIGKTSLLRHIMKSSSSSTSSSGAITRPETATEFDSAEMPTVGAQLYSCAVGNVNIECWDTPGQDTERRGVLLHTRRADIIFVVYDISSAESLQSLDDVVAHINKNGLLPWATVCLIGNKVDLEDSLRQVETLSAINFARKYKFSNFFETSAKTGVNVNIALSNALLKCEKERRCADHRTSFRDAIAVGRASSVDGRKNSVASSIDSRTASSSKKASEKCAC